VTAATLVTVLLEQWANITLTNGSCYVTVTSVSIVYLYSAESLQHLY